MVGRRNARPPRIRGFGILAFPLLPLLVSGACKDTRPLLLRPTPVTAVNWGPPAPGQHALSGMVIEADDRPVQGALVSTSYGSTRTDAGGRFRLEQIGPTSVDVRKDGYETRRRETYNALATTDLSVELVIAPVVRVEAGATYRGMLFPKDVGHYFGDVFSEFGGFCRGRLIRWQVPARGSVSVRAEWAESVTLTLYLMAETTPWPQFVVASGSGSVSASVDSPGIEVQACLGVDGWATGQYGLPEPVAFTMTTSFK